MNPKNGMSVGAVIVIAIGTFAVGIISGVIIGVAAEQSADEDRVSTATTNRPSTASSSSTSTTTTSTSTTTTQPPPPAEPIEVGRWQGSNDTETDNFTVTGTWELSWTVSGGAGAGVRIMTPGGSMADSISIDPGTSTSQVRQGGTFYLDISTFGASYNIAVIDLPG